MTYTDLMRDCINEGMYKLTQALRRVQPINFGFAFNHILERSHDREIEAAEIRHALVKLSVNGMCQFLYYHNLPDEIKPWRLFISYGPVIMHFSRRNDDWVFATVLKSGEHNKYRDEKDTFTAYIDL